MPVLVIGSGGREHAICRKLAESPRVDSIYALPGNAGIAEVATILDGSPTDPTTILKAAKELSPDLIVIGPEDPIAAGVGDILRDAGFAVFAPSRAAAELESSKVFAKEFMKRHSIPTAHYHAFDADQVAEARDYVVDLRGTVVLKADGLAAGKGVVILENARTAADEVERMLRGDAFGAAGQRVLVEEYLEGEEASIFAISDGNNYVLLAPAQDHKRIGDDDTGPNTGGMGSYAPAPVITDELLSRIDKEIVRPTIYGMRSEKRPFVGCLFVGLMISEAGTPRVIEYNCRFGDPETQVILPLMKDDLYELMVRAASGELAGVANPTVNGAAACVVAASGGYPGPYEKGKEITGVDRVVGDDRWVIHAGTATDGDRLVTAGGRVLGVVGYDSAGDLRRAVDAAYEGVEEIAFDGMTYRSDIARRAFDR